MPCYIAIIYIILLVCIYDNKKIIKLRWNCGIWSIPNNSTIKYKGIEKINGDEHRGGRGYHGRKESGKKVKEKYADILVIF